MAAANKEVREYTAKKLYRLLSGTDPAAQRASLANLRRGIGHPPGEIPQLWGEYLSDMPEEMYGQYGQPSKEEWAIYTALTLFALHQQGRDPAKDPMHCENRSVGAAAALLASDEDEMKRILRRLNAAATANSVAALSHYLRGLIQLLRGQGIPIDYVSLAGDIYAFQFPETINSVRLKWGQDFYSTYYKNQKGETDHDEEN